MPHKSHNAAEFRAGDLLFVMALDLEYGPRLRSRIDPLMTGVGPVEAAVSLTEALAKRAAAGRLPGLVVSLGSAGSNRLAQGQVYQATSVAYRDMDASPLGVQPGVTPFLGLPPVLNLAPLVPGLARASLSTGADVISGAAYGNIAAEMVDMESYALLRACQRFDLPLVAIRGISDGSRELGGLGDWTETLGVIDERLAGAVDTLLQSLAMGTLEWPAEART